MLNASITQSLNQSTNRKIVFRVSCFVFRGSLNQSMSKSLNTIANRKIVNRKISKFSKARFCLQVGQTCRMVLAWDTVMRTPHSIADKRKAVNASVGYFGYLGYLGSLGYFRLF